MIKRPAFLKTKSKYGNHKCTFDGLSFDSKKELKRYHLLKLFENKGIIKNLIVHPKYQLVLPDGTPLVIKSDKRNTKATYSADFSYLNQDGELIIEDVKSPYLAKDKYFKLKRAIFEATTKQNITVVL